MIRNFKIFADFFELSVLIPDFSLSAVLISLIITLYTFNIKYKIGRVKSPTQKNVKKENPPVKIANFYFLSPSNDSLSFFI